MPSNGIFARVLQEGEISVRDTIQVLPETGKEPFRAAVITLSDKGAAGEREDKSDPLAEKLLTEAGSVYRLPFLDFASATETDNQLLIRSIRFMQVESP